MDSIGVVVMGLKYRSSRFPWRASVVGAAITCALAIAVWLWRRWSVPVDDVVVASGTSDEWPIEVPQEAQSGDPPLQMPANGYGPLFHRQYRTDIAAPRYDAATLMGQIKAHIEDFCPAPLAKFTKIKGDPSQMRVGDEYDIEILAPWNGKVRVVDVQPDSFAFVTLVGHPEAGQIRFRLLPSPDHVGALRFEILSWARSRDSLVDIAYRNIPVGQEVQKNAWVEFCRRVQEASGGKRIGAIQVLTEERTFKEEVVPREE